MTVSNSALVFAMGCLLLAPAISDARAQSSQAGAPQGMPPMPKPGPEHEMLKEDVGTWDAVVETFMPGAPPQTSKGVETDTLGCGGLCLITDFTGEMMPGMTFHGHGTSAWDPAKKKYVGSWTDSMSAGIAFGESSWDPASRTMIGYMEGPDMSGNVVKTKSVVEYKKPGSRVFTLYGPGPDGKDATMMRITYTRRK
jgi:hypothetical protein